MATQSKTYSETKKKPPFDWNKFLKDAIQKKPLYDEHRKAVRKAKSWVTCACGNQCSIIPRDGGGEPNDWTLRDLGIDFYNKIEVRDYLGAKNVLEGIEFRSAQLIKEIRERKIQEIKEAIEDAGHVETRYKSMLKVYQNGIKEQRAKKKELQQQLKSL